MEKNPLQGKPSSLDAPVQAPPERKIGYHSLFTPGAQPERPARLHREYVDAKEEARDRH